ncbi:uncharacterized protein [Atheta coriaria]|uniref:uncharacterized protein n=1 Tax=Dalotia coriaria TaxID=877792 RepID=UPI0031F4244C
MEWFGATRYGVQDPIKDMMKTDYLEPRKPKDLVKVYESSDKTKPFATYIAELDVYLGQADGNAYKSYARLIKMRKKANFKPFGPADMYKYPGCASMEYGWFLSDPKLQNATWHVTHNQYA